MFADYKLYEKRGFEKSKLKADWLEASFPSQKRLVKSEKI